jgi:hypothetical protein
VAEFFDETKDQSIGKVRNRSEVFLGMGEGHRIAA